MQCAHTYSNEYSILKMTRKIIRRSRRSRLTIRYNRTNRRKYPADLSSSPNLPLPYELQHIFPISIRVERYGGLKHRLRHWTKYIDKKLGLDGRNLNKRQWITMGRVSALTKMRRGEIGCYWAHRDAWKEIIDRQLPMGLVLEDDICMNYTDEISNRLTRFFNEFRNTDIDWDVIYIGHFNRGPYREENKSFGGTQLVRSLACDGCMMYLVSQKGAQFLYDHSLPMRDPVDIYIQLHSQAGNINSFSWKPRLCFCVNEGSDTGSII